MHTMMTTQIVSQTANIHVDGWNSFFFYSFFFFYFFGGGEVLFLVFQCVVLLTQPHRACDGWNIFDNQEQDQEREKN